MAKSPEVGLRPNIIRDMHHDGDVFVIPGLSQATQQDRNLLKHPSIADAYPNHTVYAIKGKILGALPPLPPLTAEDILTPPQNPDYLNYLNAKANLDAAAETEGVSPLACAMRTTGLNENKK